MKAVVITGLFTVVVALIAKAECGSGKGESKAVVVNVSPGYTPSTQEILEEKTKIGINLADSKRLVEAYPFLIKGVEKGDLESMVKLARIYRTGILGVSRDVVRAKVLYETVSQKAERVELKAEALYGLGLCYRVGEGKHRDDTKAVSLIRDSAELGNTDAMVQMGYFCRIGVGLKERDFQKAVGWYVRAANKNNSEGLFHLGRCYMLGKGVEPNAKTAIRFYAKSAALGNAMAMDNLGICHEQGIGGFKPNKAEALPWFQKAADAGDMYAMKSLGDYHAKGLGGLSPDQAQAISWYSKSEALGNPEASIQLKKAAKLLRQE